MTLTETVVPAIANENRALALINQAGSIIIPMGPVDYDAMDAALAGETGQSSNLFPGEPLTFKKGSWQWGYGKKGAVLKGRALEAGFVALLDHSILAWQFWSDGKPTTGPMAFPGLGQKLPDRRSLGALDESKWEVDNKDVPQDPWKKQLVFPLRYETPDADGKCAMHHVSLGGWSQTTVGARLLKEFSTAARLNHGLVPVITLDADLWERSDDSGDTYHVPVMKIVDWVEPLPSDSPKATVSKLLAPPEPKPEPKVAPRELPPHSGGRVVRRTEAAQAIADNPDEDGDGETEYQRIPEDSRQAAPRQAAPRQAQQSSRLGAKREDEAGDRAERSSARIGGRAVPRTEGGEDGRPRAGARR